MVCAAAEHTKTPVNFMEAFIKIQRRQNVKTFYRHEHADPTYAHILSKIAASSKVLLTFIREMKRRRSQLGEKKPPDSDLSDKTMALPFHAMHFAEASS